MDLIMSKFDKTKIKAGAHFLTSITNILAQYCKSIAKSAAKLDKKPKVFNSVHLLAHYSPKTVDMDIQNHFQIFHFFIKKKKIASNDVKEK